MSTLLALLKIMFERLEISSNKETKRNARMYKFQHDDYTIHKKIIYHSLITRHYNYVVV